ncbi:MAG: hypothetical protein Q8Q48_02650 [Candidatus Staskawiczbacteria bacterium]|nr:hypothetical protein [Candidatus Staskawiczbacteria bacterium]
MDSSVNISKFVVIGIFSSLILLSVYFGIMSVASSFSDALAQFREFWLWFSILVVGFGAQAGLYFYVKDALKRKETAGSVAPVAVSGGVSAGSMVVCCLHHVTDVLPLLGLAAAATFLATYQFFFIIVGVLSNLVGIVLMLEILQKHDLAGGFMKKILVYDMNKAKKIAIGSSLAVSVVVFVLTGGFLNNNKQKTAGSVDLNEGGAITLQSQSGSQNGITFDISPVLSSQFEFDITITTHSGSLDFDLAKVSFFTDGNGNTYYPIEWQGSPPGGHHRTGTLIFSRPNSSVETVKLSIEDRPRETARIFTWDLKNN